MIVGYKDEHNSSLHSFSFFLLSFFIFISSFLVSEKGLKVFISTVSKVFSSLFTSDDFTRNILSVKIEGSYTVLNS